MNTKRFVLAGLGAAVWIFVFETAVHGFALAGMYESTASLWRPMEEMNMAFNLLIQIVTAFVLAYFAIAYRVRDWRKGALLGSYVGVLMAVMQLGTYIFLPLTLALPVIWAVVVWAKLVVAGVIIGHVYED